MTDIAIRVEDLSKLYHIGRAQRHDTLRDALVHTLSLPRRRRNSNPNKKTRKTRAIRGKNNSPNPPTSCPDDTIWALKDVSFEVKRGEVIGIIGRNGAGKSTLLKILSRITEPTEGRAVINGRVGSLLEVGTGFHPELTGRENIYLNGAILGMRRTEIARQFDEIVAFAEIEKFLDTPVKRYSSGMHVRLAFAVAAHLEPEILLVDEVLAVGDFAFQKKCLGKMEDVAEEGRTVLFVSHNMLAVETLCTRAMLVEHGRVTESGRARRVVSAFLSRNHQADGNPLLSCHRTGNGQVRIVGFRLEDPDGNVLEAAQTGAPTVFAFEYHNTGCGPEDRISCSFSVHTNREVGVFHYYSHFSGVYYQNLPPAGHFRCLLPELPLAPGDYLVMCRVVMNGDHKTGLVVDWPQVFLPIRVTGGDYYGTGDPNVTTWAPTVVKGAWF